MCGILGRLWKRYNAAGAIASLLGACATSASVMLVPEWETYWEGEPVIPSILIATAAGVCVSLLTSPDKLSREEALALLAKERETMEK